MKNVTLGFSDITPDLARQVVEAALSIAMTERESLYYGEYWRFGPSWNGGEELRLVPNYNTDEKEWLLEDHRNHAAILYVSRTERADEIVRLLAPWATVIESTPSPNDHVIESTPSPNDQ